MRDNDEVDHEIDSLLSRTQDQLELVEKRAHYLAIVISGGTTDER